MKVSTSITVKAQRDHVFSVFTDFTTMPNKLSGIKALKIIAGDKPAEGFIWSETRVMGKNEGTVEFEIVQFNKNFSYTAVGEHSNMRFTTLQTFESIGQDETRVTVDSLTEATSFGMRLVLLCFGWAMSKGMNETLSKDLDELKRWAES